MNHSFDVDHAAAYGVVEAILIGNFQFWIAKNKANGIHVRDGRTWTYNTVRAYAALFPYLTYDQVRRGLERLVARGVLVSANYNSSGMDRTKWFAFSDENGFLPHLANLPNAFGTGATPSGKSANSLIGADVNTDKKPDGGRGSRLQPDWFLPKEWGDWALDNFPGWDAAGVRAVADKFKDHWLAASGQTSKKRDWLATWRNWCRNEPSAAGAQKGAAIAWWATDAGVAAKGLEHGLRALAGETGLMFRARVQAAVDAGKPAPAAIADESQQLPLAPAAPAPEAVTPKPQLSPEEIAARRAALHGALKKPSEGAAP